MDAASLLRTFGSLSAVLGLLLLALWATRRYNIRLPGATPALGQRRLAVVERVAIDARRSVALIRRDGREHLVLISPEGHQVVESGIEPPAPTPAPASDFAAILATTTVAQERASPVQDVAQLIELLASRLADVRRRWAARGQPALVRERPAPPVTKSRRAARRARDRG